MIKKPAVPIGLFMLRLLYAVENLGHDVSVPSIRQFVSNELGKPQHRNQYYNALDELVNRALLIGKLENRKWVYTLTDKGSLVLNRRRIDLNCRRT